MAALLKTISYSDDYLITMIRDKNKMAFEKLYDKYAAAVYGSICKQVTDKKMCEEILQQTFLKVWHALTEGNIISNRLLLWMMNVARNIINEKTIGSKTNAGYTIAI